MLPRSLLRSIRTLRGRFAVLDGVFVFTTPFLPRKLVAVGAYVGSGGGADNQHSDNLQLFVSLSALVSLSLERFHGSKLRVTDVLITRSIGRFGNQIRQISLAGAFGTAFGATRVLTPRGGLIIAQDHELDLPDLDLKVRAISHRQTSFFGALWQSLRSARMYLTGTFFYYPLHPRANPKIIRDSHKIARTIGGSTIFSRLAPQPQEDFVIHLRGGDVFSKKRPHPKYGQPPFAFYQKVLLAVSPKSLTVVSEDKKNPNLDRIIDFAKSMGMPVEFKRRSFDEDLTLLLQARVICASRGTFIEAIAGLSQVLERLYVFGPGGIYPEGVELVRLIDSEGTYWDSVCSDNWLNTTHQRTMMVSYGQENLSILDSV